MLTRSVFGLNSKRAATIPDKSYSERSAVATKCSAASSVLRTGSFFNLGFLLFIVPDFLSMHIASTDWTNEGDVASLAQREYDQDVSSCSACSNRFEPLLRSGMDTIRKQSDRPSKNRLDLRDRNAMASTLVPVIVVPIKSRGGEVHDAVYDCTYKCQPILPVFPVTRSQRTASNWARNKPK